MEANETKCIIDRFEGRYAVVELPNGCPANIAKAALPPGATEGDTLVLSIDRQDTQKRAAEVSALMQNLKKQG